MMNQQVTCKKKKKNKNKKTKQNTIKTTMTM